MVKDIDFKPVRVEIDGEKRELFVIAPPPQVMKVGKTTGEIEHVYLARSGWQDWTSGGRKGWCGIRPGTNSSARPKARSVAAATDQSGSGRSRDTLAVGVTRRELLALAAYCCSARGAHAAQAAGMAAQPVAPIPPVGPADVTLRIAESTIELGPRRTVKTIAYNGQVPGPLVRVKEGRPVVVDVWNDTGDEEFVHWHGLHIPPEVDGAREEGTPPVPPRGHRRYTFTPEPAGTRWYHSHGMTGRNLRRTTYTGQFGLLIVEPDNEQGAYDLDIPILLHEWEPRLTRDGPLDVEYRFQTVNGRLLGAGEPIRVRQGQRVLFRILNASATLIHRLGLPGHRFHVVALDGYAVPTPRAVPLIGIGPGERVDAIVEMNSPGVWILGEVELAQRVAGLGIVVEYAGAAGAPQWQPISPIPWNYSVFGGDGSLPTQPDAHLSLVFRSTDNNHHWTINGKSHPRADDIMVEANRRYRWVLDNQSAHPHPIHLHRHAFDLVGRGGTQTFGIRKDVVVVPAWQQVEVDVLTTHPGLSLFHCHQQLHMDMGFMSLMRYAT